MSLKKCYKEIQKHFNQNSEKETQIKKHQFTLKDVNVKDPIVKRNIANVLMQEYNAQSFVNVLTVGTKHLCFNKRAKLITE